MSPPLEYLRECPKYAFTTSIFFFFFFFGYIKKVNKKEEKSEEKDRRLKRKGKKFYNWLTLYIYLYIFDLILSCFHVVWLSRLIRTEDISFC